MRWQQTQSKQELYLKAASFWSNCTRSRVRPCRRKWEESLMDLSTVTHDTPTSVGCITRRHEAHIPLPALAAPKVASGSSSARKASAASAAASCSSSPAVCTISCGTGEKHSPSGLSTRYSQTHLRHQLLALCLGSLCKCTVVGLDEHQVTRGRVNDQFARGKLKGCGHLVKDHTQLL